MPQTFREATKKKKSESKIEKAIPKTKSAEKPKSQHTDSQAKITGNNGTEHNSTITTSGGGKKAYISVTCVEGTDVFVDRRAS